MGREIQPERRKPLFRKIQKRWNTRKVLWLTVSISARLLMIVRDVGGRKLINHPREGPDTMNTAESADAHGAHPWSSENNNHRVAVFSSLTLGYQIAIGVEGGPPTSLGKQDAMEGEEEEKGDA